MFRVNAYRFHLVDFLDFGTNGISSTYIDHFEFKITYKDVLFSGLGLNLT